MWKCQYIPGKSLELVMRVDLQDSEDVNSAVSQVMIWNYNKSIQVKNYVFCPCACFALVFYSSLKFHAINKGIFLYIEYLMITSHMLVSLWW